MAERSIGERVSAIEEHLAEAHREIEALKADLGGKVEFVYLLAELGEAAMLLMPSISRMRHVRVELIRAALGEVRRG